MRAKPYQIIVGLLTISVLAILALQAYWIRNFYIQKRADFNRQVFGVLEQVSNTLQARQGIRHLQQEVIINDNGTNTSRLSVQRAGEGQVKVELRSESSTASSSATLDSVKKTINSFSSSSVKIYKPSLNGVYKVVLGNDKKKDSAVGKLIDKMLLEIKTMDTDEKNTDTLKSIIKRALAVKGLFLPFEFALKKIKANQQDVLCMSEGFNPTKQHYTSDLSVGNVFNNNRFLQLQFIGDKGFVLASIKNTLLLSLLFSCLIIGVFYYTLRLILKQKKLNEIKNDFINNMTHELKTPIATIALATDAMAHPEVRNNEERFSEYTRILKEENQKLNQHVERVLQMAMLDKGELKLNKTRLNLVELLQSAIKSHKLLIEKTGAQLDFKHEQAIYFYGDEEHLLAVFNNLLDNALKYSVENCLIEIMAFVKGNFIEIGFKDNGIGIEAEHHEKVFEKFFRAQGGNLHDVKGFGLGLSHVRSIVAAHNGIIKLKSEKGRGSEFIIEFSNHV